MRIAIISDIHEDYINLQKALNLINNKDVEKIFCLGDIVGFENRYYTNGETRSAHKCLQLLIENSVIIVPGNHDNFAAKQLPVLNEKIDFPENWYSLTLDEREEKYGNKFFLYKDEAQNDLNEKDIDFIRDLSSRETLELDNIKILFTHFIYPDINGNVSIFKNSNKSFLKHFKWMSELNINISFVGHTHFEGLAIAKKRGFKITKFGIYSLKDESQIIFCPCIAQSKRKNGFLIFDSNHFLIEAISLD